MMISGQMSSILLRGKEPRLEFWRGRSALLSVAKPLVTVRRDEVIDPVPNWRGHDVEGGQRGVRLRQQSKDAQRRRRVCVKLRTGNISSERI